MSRDSTPASLIGGLAIAGSSESSNPDMPVTTRGMWQSQTKRKLGASQHASSGAAAGSSTTRATPSVRQASSRSGGRGMAQRAQPPRSTRTTRRGDDDDDSDGDDDEESDDDDSDNAKADHIINEIMSVFADTYPSPHTFSRVSPTDSSVSSEQTRDCRRLARLLSATVAREPQVLTVLRREFSRVYCAARLVNNFWKRDGSIERNLYANLEDQAQGRDVPDSIADWRQLNIDIEKILKEYQDDLSENHRQSLASLLIAIVNRIFRTDWDMYYGRNRTIYAGESSGGNLFRRFLSSRAKPIEFIGPLHRLEANLLATQTDNLRNLITQYNSNDRNGAEQEQYDRVVHALRSIWTRATGQQV